MELKLGWYVNFSYFIVLITIFDSLGYFLRLNIKIFICDYQNKSLG